MRTIVVIPCYNEANRLDVAAYLKFARHSPSLRLFLVNDGSSDLTHSILRTLKSQCPSLEVIDLPKNLGKAEAVRQGVLAALRLGADYVGYWDADLATPLEVVHEFLAVLRRRPDISIVMGSRLSMLGHTIRRLPLRRALGHAFARVVTLLFGIRFIDTQCGAKLFRITTETKALFAEPFRTRWIFDVEILARLLLLRANRRSAASAIYEFPLENWREVSGSKLRTFHFVQAIGELAKIYIRYLAPGARPYTPVQFDFLISSSAGGDDGVEPNRNRAA